LPVASTVRSAVAPESLPTATILPSRTPHVAGKPGVPGPIQDPAAGDQEIEMFAGRGRGLRRRRSAEEEEAAQHEKKREERVKVAEGMEGVTHELLRECRS
jgi:hypothetical protein